MASNYTPNESEKLAMTSTNVTITMRHNTANAKTGQPFTTDGQRRGSAVSLFRNAAKKYCALGSPADVAADIVKFYEAGCRTIVFDLIGPYEERIEHTEAIASDVLPLLASYRH